MNRRDFLRVTGTASASVLISHTRAKMQANAFVYEVFDEAMVTGTKALPEKVNEQVVGEAVDAIIKKMANTADLGQAWQALLPNIKISSKVAIKVNALKDNNSPQLATLKAIVRGLTSMFNGKFPAASILLFDNNLGIGGSTSSNHVDGAFGSSNLNALGIWHGKDTYNGPAIKLGTKTVYVSTSMAAAGPYCINFLAPRRHHSYAGNLSGFIKNMMGMVSKSKTTYDAERGGFHNQTNFYAYVDLFKNYVKNNTCLYVGDFILVPKDEAANYYDKVEKRIAIGTDPCAMDSHAVDILKKYYSTTKKVPTALANANLGTTSYRKVLVTPGSEPVTRVNVEKAIKAKKAGGSSVADVQSTINKYLGQ